MYRRTKFATFACTLLSYAAVAVCASAQSPSKGMKAIDYSKEPFVIEKIVTKIVFENDGKSRTESTARIRVQSQAGLQQSGVLNFPYASATSIIDVVYVRVIKPDNRVVETPSENVLDMPADITRQAPFYSDLKDKQVAVKGLEIGDTVEYEFRLSVEKPLDPGQFWYAGNFFQSGICLEEDLQVSVPHDRYVKVESPKLQPTIAEQGAYRVYKWKTANLISSADKKDTKLTDSEEPSYPSVQLTTFRNWNDLGQWFQSLAAPRAVPTAEIRAKADELTRNAKTDSEKIQLIYDYVSTKFRYIGIALGIGRYQPHVADDVLSNGYGDCKDKDTLFTALLAAVNIKAYPALISSTMKIDSEIPSPLQFDHVITAVPQGNGFLFLDTTPEVAPFGFLMAGLRGKEALVIPDATHAVLIKTPEDPPFKSFFKFHADGTLDDAGTFEGKMQLSVRGDVEIIYRLAFRQAGQSQWKEVAQQVSNSIGFGGTVSDVTATPPDATDSPFRIEYTYNRKEYGDWANRSIIAPFPFIFLPVVPDDAKNKTKPMKLGTPGEWSYEGSMKLPPDSTPRAGGTIDLHEEFADYRSSHSVSNGIMHFERHLVVKTHEIAPAQIDAYRKWVEAINDDEARFISLRGTDAPSADVAGSPEAQAIFAEGAKAWQRQNVAAATDAFQRAVDKDPKYAEAWWWLGAGHLQMRDTDHAIEEMKKAIALDPKGISNYKNLAFTLRQLHRDQEALDLWRKFKEQNPNDADGPANIASILTMQKHYAEAAPEWEAAVKLNQHNANFLVELGDAYMRSDNKEKGIAAIEKGVDQDDSPPILNDAAYILADNKVNLDDAFRYAKKAVGDAEDDTLDITLDRLSVKDLQTVPVLVAYWDTLGWVDFRMGNLDQAEKFLRAAWSVSLSPEVGEHLRQVYEKEGKNREVPRDQLTLQQFRTVKLRKLATKHATAEFFLLFAPGPKIVDVKFISGSDELRSADKAITAGSSISPFLETGMLKLFVAESWIVSRNCPDVCLS